MKRINGLPVYFLGSSVAVLGWVVPAVASPIVSQGTLTNKTYADSGGGSSYTNASSINVSTTNDLLSGLLPTATKSLSGKLRRA